jgi:hypothetical protein
VHLLAVMQGLGCMVQKLLVVLLLHKGSCGHQLALLLLPAMLHLTASGPVLACSKLLWAKSSQLPACSRSKGE